MLRHTLRRQSVFAAANTQWLAPRTKPSLPRRTLYAIVYASAAKKLAGLIFIPIAAGGLYFLTSAVVCDQFEAGYDVMYVEREVDSSMLSTDVFYMVEDWDERVKGQLAVGDVIMYTGTDAEARDYIRAQYAATGMRSGAHKYSNVGVVVRPYDPATKKGPFMLEVSRNREGLADWKGVVRRNQVQVVDATERVNALGVMSSDGRAVMGLDEARKEGLLEADSCIVGTAPRTDAEMLNPLTPYPPRPFPLYKRVSTRRLVMDGGAPVSSLLAPEAQRQFLASVNAYIEAYEGAPMDTLHLPHGWEATEAAQKRVLIEAVRSAISGHQSDADLPPLIPSAVNAPSFSETREQQWANAKATFYTMRTLTAMALRPATHEQKRASYVSKQRNVFASSSSSPVSVSAFGGGPNPFAPSAPPLMVSSAELCVDLLECLGLSTVIPEPEAVAAAKRAAEGGVGAGGSGIGAVLGGKGAVSSLPTQLMFCAMAGVSSVGKLVTGAMGGAAAADGSVAAAGSDANNAANAPSSSSPVATPPTTYEEKKAAWLAKRRHEKELAAGKVPVASSVVVPTPSAAAAAATAATPSSPAGQQKAFKDVPTYPITDIALLRRPRLCFSHSRNMTLFPGHFANNMNYSVSNTLELIKENERKALGIDDHLIYGLKGPDETHEERLARLEEEARERNGPIVLKFNLYEKDAAELKVLANKARMGSALRLDERYAYTAEAKVMIPKWGLRWNWHEHLLTGGM